MKYTLFYPCLSALLLAGCSDATPLSDADTLQVEAEIQQAPGRALTDYDKSSFTTGDQIDLRASNATDSKHTYTKSAKGYWTSTNPCTVAGSVTFTGYYPSADATIAADQTTPQAFHDSNLLKTPAVSPTANTVRFTGSNAFAPQGVKITVIIRYSNTCLPVSATVGAATSINATAGSTTQTRCLYTTADNLTTASALQNWTCIAAAGTHTLNFSIVKKENGTDKTGTFTDIERTFTAGKNYTYNFLSTNELILTGVTVTPFQDAGEEDAGSAS